MTEKILVVDDEQAIVDAVSYALRAAGFEVDEFGDGESALDAARATPYDVLVVDVRLPGLSGIEICRRLRAEGDVPILMLTAMDAEVDRVLGLEAGADDYVTKPFSPRELVARIKAILRRAEPAPQERSRELGDRERLRHVVVGAGLEAEHAIDLGVHRGQHEDRDVALGP